MLLNFKKEKVIYGIKIIWKYILKIYPNTLVFYLLKIKISDEIKAKMSKIISKKIISIEDLL